MFSPFPLLLLLVFAFGFVRGSSDTQCVFNITHTGESFDLCQLWNNGPFELAWIKETPPTRTEYRYSFDLGSPLVRDRTFPSDLQCLEDTHICLRVINTRPNHPLEPARILQVVPIATIAGFRPTAKLSDKATDIVNHRKPLILSLHGGIYNEEKQKASIYFYCDPNSHLPTPKYMWSFNGTHAFSWSSRYACPKSISTSPEGSPEDEPEEESEPPADPELEEDLQPPKSSGLALFILFVSILGCMSILHRVVGRKWTVSRTSRVIKMNFQWAIYNIITLCRLTSKSDEEEGGRLIAEIGEELPLTPKSGTFPGSKWNEERMYGSVSLRDT
ncbi:autophagy-related protein 27-domain-containing protein [Flagelloscypha sp. PMI_526]|nr:autophagy-related protein 27-domain-containing protein [Flagelloscypha sp. PMI_526]